MITAALIRKRLDPVRVARLADGLAVAVAVSLPWSVSATSILVLLWLLALIPTLDLAAVRHALARPAGGLPVLFFAIGASGTLWAHVSLAERLGGLDSFVRFLAIPLLFVQFNRSDRGMWVLAGFLASCTALLLLSAALVLWPVLGNGWANDLGVPVKAYITQSVEFVLCTFGLAWYVAQAIRNRKWATGAALMALAAAFLANVFYVATGRTTIVVIIVLLLVFFLHQFTRKGAFVALVAALAVGGAVWLSSPYLRMRVTGVYQEVESYRIENAPTSSGQRLEYWRKSIGFIADAPIIGHGTGSIGELFRRSILGRTGVAGLVSTNPHNQTLTVAVQLGLIGTAVLYAMWIAHLLFFRGARVVEWIGLVIVVQNIVGSLFNSFLFDYTEGWIYVFGVGVTGGMLLRSSAIGTTGPERSERGMAAEPLDRG
jgi:O-antigen ligase